jgi:general secretion pathway protein A
MSRRSKIGFSSVTLNDQPAPHLAAAGPSMYEEFYGFGESPFNITPDPRFLFFSDRHLETYNHILWGLQERKGFIQITGEVGAGKTTICRAILEELGPNYRTALILNPVMTPKQLLWSFVTELGLDPKLRSRLEMLTELNQYLLDQFAAGNDVVLFIDEAQDLSMELMEQVRLLSNLETDQQKLLQIVLIGQPELREMLDRGELRQLRQRITVRYHLTSLSFDETEYYIYHRLQVAGANSIPTFSRGAIRKIYRYSRGVPRLINAVCDKALLCGYVLGTQHLKTQHLRRAIRELEGRFT